MDMEIECSLLLGDSIGIDRPIRASGHIGILEILWISHSTLGQLAPMSVTMLMISTPKGQLSGRTRTSISTMSPIVDVATAMTHAATAVIHVMDGAVLLVCGINAVVGAIATIIVATPMIADGLQGMDI